MLEIVDFLNSIIWSPVLVGLCLCAGLLFSIRTRFVQLRMIPEMWRLLFQKKEDEIGLSSFVESTLGQVYKERIEGQYRGGPAFYIERGLRNKWFAWAFSIITILASVFFCPGVQSNSIAAAWYEAFEVPHVVTATIIGSILCFVGGLRRISQFSSIVVPFMAQAYIIVALVVVGLNYQQIPAVISLIFSSAFGADSLTGGMLGAAISWGVRRGIYSNEAGQGTAPHASSAAAVSHPTKQGLVQAFSIYIDTLFVCSATGFMILMTGMYNVVGENGQTIVNHIPGVDAGPVYTQMAINAVMPGWGSPFIGLAIFFFAFTTILGYYYMAETNVAYLNRYLKKPMLMTICKAVFIVTVTFGAIRSSTLIWSMADVGVGLMAWCNIIAIFLLQGIAIKALKDYEAQKAKGLNPVFHPEALGIPYAGYWEGSRAEANLAIEEESGVDNLSGLDSKNPE